MSEQRVTDQELAASEPAPLILLGGRNAADLRDARPAEPIKGYDVRGIDEECDEIDDRVDTLAHAIASWTAHAGNGATVSIYQVHPDGREERLPSYEEALTELERIKDPVDGLEAKLVERTAEREEARDWVRRLTSTTRVLTCAFCGMAYPPGTPESNDAALTAHVRVCPKHPMREAEAEIERLRTAPPADPLAALEAAERRLLEAGGWTPDAATKGRWIEPKFKHSYLRRNAVQIERDARRLAAKGGA